MGTLKAKRNCCCIPMLTELRVCVCLCLCVPVCLFRFIPIKKNTTFKKNGIEYNEREITIKKNQSANKPSLQTILWMALLRFSLRLTNDDGVNERATRLCTVEEVRVNYFIEMERKREGVVHDFTSHRHCVQHSNSFALRIQLKVPVRLQFSTSEMGNEDVRLNVFIVLCIE